MLEHADLDVDVGGVNIQDKLEKDCDSTEGPRYIQNACFKLLHGPLEGDVEGEMWVGGGGTLVTIPVGGGEGRLAAHS